MGARASQSKQPSVRFLSASTALLSLVLAFTIPSCSSGTGETGTGSLDGGSETSTSGQLCSGKSCATGETCCAACSGKSFCSVDCPGFSCAAPQDATTSAESGATSDADLDERGDTGQDGCGVTIYETNRACQKWLDDNCCAEERSCDSACQTIVACFNKCPAPPTDACLAACSPAFGNAGLEEIANCSKSAPSTPSGQSCAWPK